ncbi:MAG: molybdopterin-synthase adenylyltransferase MoeB [Bacteroidota bacterium]|jgi:adenylyltransferase/sulfurtransferase
MNLSSAELLRYGRHLTLPELGLEGQLKLKKGSVLVVGAGGLGSPILLYLAAAGVGRIGIIDPDVVDVTNLQRQILYNSADIGKSKAETARRKLLELNPHIDITAYPIALTRHNALQIIENYDVIADGTDNFQTRYLVNDACVIKGKVNIYGSIFRFEGQVSVFNYPQANGERGVHYRDLFPAPPPPDMIPDCAEGGVLGVLPGIIGSIQASEAIKVLTGVGEPLAGRLFLFDAASFMTRVLKVSKNPNLAPITELVDYDIFCGIKPIVQNNIRNISASDLLQQLKSNESFQLIDVREKHEFESGFIEGAESMPLSQLTTFIPQIQKDKKVILYCQSGKRSAKALEQLIDNHGFTNAIHLEDGFAGWLKFESGKKEL